MRKEKNQPTTTEPTITPKPKPTPPTYAPVEFTAAPDIFPHHPDIVRAALSTQKDTARLTIEQAKSLVKAFAEREVNEHGRHLSIR